MLINVNTDGALHLEAPEDFTRFGIRTAGTPRPALDDALSKIGRVEGEGYAWVSQDALRRLSPKAGDQAWEDGFAQMISYARSKGWLDEDGGIRAHIESVAAENTGVDQTLFKQSMRNLAGGVGIITTGSQGGRYGLTASAITSVCAEPPSLLICVNKSSHSYAALIDNGTFAVNLLAAEHGDLAMRFASSKLTGEAKFEGENWVEGALTTPVLADALCAFECELVSHHEVGTHGIFIGRVINAMSREGEPLINFQGKLQSIAH